MDIKVYMSPSCEWSKRTADWLQKKKVQFQALDVMEYDQYRDELLEKSNQMSTPVIEVDGNVIVGFNEGLLQ